MEVPLPWERLLWSHRAWWPPGTRYALTDFRVVCQHGSHVREMAVDDIAEVQLGRTSPSIARSARPRSSCVPVIGICLP